MAVLRDDEQHLTDSKERVIALTEQRGEVVLIEDGNERRLMIYDPRHRCIATIRWGDFSALCNALAFDGSHDPTGADHLAEMMKLAAERDAVLDLHQPERAEIEVFFFDSNGDPNPLHERFDAGCPKAYDKCAGHITEILTCSECGETADFDGSVFYLKWPCRTARALGAE